MSPHNQYQAFVKNLKGLKLLAAEDFTKILDQFSCELKNTAHWQNNTETNFLGAKHAFKLKDTENYKIKQLTVVDVFESINHRIGDTTRLRSSYHLGWVWTNWNGKISFFRESPREFTERPKLGLKNLFSYAYL